MTKIGIIREGKIPPDHRVPLTPQQCREVMYHFPGAEIIVQPSSIRIIPDEKYREAGIPVSEDIGRCDILMGIKEVPIHELIRDKTYIFFSHTIKKQPHNRKLLQTILEKNITLMDYECMTDAELNRIIGFGHYAGIVGAYNGILGYGLKYRLFHARRAIHCSGLHELKEELNKIRLPNMKIIVTGNGRVANGAIELLGLLHIRRITPYEFTHYTFREPTYTQLHSYDYYESLDGSPWNREMFYAHPEKFRSTFMKYTRWCDLLLHCAYWDPRAPKMFTKEEMRHPEFGISVIADVSCDINGPIPSTIRASSIAEPFYSYNPATESADESFSQHSITIMAVDNLPCELSLDASENFGKELIKKIFPSLLGNHDAGMLERATIARNGKLLKRFKYLEEYVYSTNC